MISEQSIDGLRDVIDIVEVIQRHNVTLKQKGDKWTACCPFHEEKSPSFSVSTTKQIYKCFGCGEGGDAIKFVMKKEDTDFITAIRSIASIYNYTLEETEESPEEKAAAAKKTDLYKINTAAARHFQQKLLGITDFYHWCAQELAFVRAYDYATLIEFQIGYAPADWRLLTMILISKDLYAPAEELGLVKTSDAGSVYDTFRDRLIFPIHNEQGQIVGFGGRKPRSCEDKDNPKYINSKESSLYKKDRVLYGLYQAKAHIKKLGFAILVEGYTDVITMHFTGANNAIGRCGTAFTDSHAKLLKRYTNKVLLFSDGDMAGQKANFKAVDILLENDFIVEICPLPLDEDPDTFARKLFLTAETIPGYQAGNTNVPILDYIDENKVDAIIYKAEKLFQSAGEDIDAKSLRLEDISVMIACIGSEMKSEHYIKLLSKKLGIKSNLISNQVKKDVEKKKEKQIQFVAEGQKALASWINKDHYYRYGFDQRVDYSFRENTGIYFARSNNESIQLTNFTIKPLMHVFTSDDSNRRLTEINNGWVREVIELPSRAWSSCDMFESTLMDKGVFFTNDGFGKPHLNKLKSAILPQYQRCYELKNLGWQKEGFFAYSNLIYKDGTQRFDEYGIAEVDGVNYLSMGASKILAGLRDQDDDYKNDKYLKYVDSDLTFSQWTQLMMDAYLDKGMMGVCTVILACYRDIVFKRNNNCPIPYYYGAAQSGKSKFGESVTAPFTLDMPALNLNQTTEFALWESLSRFFNVPRLFNEFDEKSIKEEFTRAFKGAFDGEGRLRGSGRKGKTQTQQINCLPVLLGQYLSTGDDGALLQRTLPVKFVEDNNRSEFQKKRFQELKDLEKIGITSISCELFKYRDYVSDNFNTRFYKMLAKMTESLKADGLMPKTRILENFVNALTITSLVADKISFAFSIDSFFEYCKEQIKSLSLIISETNALADFWKTVELMVDEDDIEQGYHFKVEIKSDILLASKERNQTFKKTFTEPKKLLYLRFSTVHSMYLKQYRSATGKSGIGSATVESYMKDLPSFIGSNPASSFRARNGKSTNTSSYIFDYEMLNVNLERTKDDENESVETRITAVLSEDSKAVDVLGKLHLEFTVLQDEGYWMELVWIEKKTYTKCRSKDINAVSALKKGTNVTLIGMLEERLVNDSLRRKLEVMSIQIIDNNGTAKESLKF
ncbi:DNA primase [Pedobacter sp.]|uniref:DNA primase n=1 Tax=Pedobacter sp. TaxID=1411316 RepID=UPI0031E3D996